MDAIRRRWIRSTSPAGCTVSVGSAVGRGGRKAAHTMDCRGPVAVAPALDPGGPETIRVGVGDLWWVVKTGVLVTSTGAPPVVRWPAFDGN